MSKRIEVKTEKLGKVCDIQIGGTPSRKKMEYFEGNEVWVSVSELNGKIIMDSKEKLTNEGIENSNAKLVPAGTVLMSFKLSLGKKAIAGVDLYTNEAIAALKIKNSEQVIPKFLFYWVDTVKWDDYSSGAVKGKCLNKRILEDIPISLPPLPEQRRIVAILDRAERLKELRKQANEEMSKYLQSVFLEMFGKSNYKIEEINNHVEETDSRNPSSNPDVIFKYVDIAGIDNTKGIVKEAKELLGKDAPSRARREIHKDDIIVSTVRPNLNATALVPDWLDGEICSTGFCVMRCKKTLHPKYLYAITRQKWFVDNLISKMKGASYPAVTNKDVLDIKIPIPPMEEQMRFAEVLDNNYSLSARQQESEKQINSLFDSLLSKTFSEA